MELWWNDTDKGNSSTWKKASPILSPSPTNLIWARQGLTTFVHGEGTATERLNVSCKYMT